MTPSNFICKEYDAVAKERSFSFMLISIVSRDRGRFKMDDILKRLREGDYKKLRFKALAERYTGRTPEGRY